MILVKDCYNYLSCRRAVIRELALRRAVRENDDSVGEGRRELSTYQWCTRLSPGSLMLSPLLPGDMGRSSGSRW